MGAQGGRRGHSPSNTQTHTQIGTGVDVRTNTNTSTNANANANVNANANTVCLHSQSSRTMLELKTVLFTRTKCAFFDQVLSETTTHTQPSADEYERPDCMQGRAIDINRVVARSMEAIKDTLPFEERLQNSVFGQLKDVLDQYVNSLVGGGYVGWLVV
mgnify:CR=1 FL=1